MGRIVITTCGSLGDLHPYIAIACRLKERGHDAVLATSPCYQQKIESLGLDFRPVRPDGAWLSDPDRVRRYSHPRWGLLRVGRELLMRAIRESYEDTLAAAEGADLLVSMVATYATRLVAEKTETPWVSALHVPMGFFSAYDSPVLDVSPLISRKLRGFGPNLLGPLFGFGKRASRFLAKPWYELRSEIGLPMADDRNPLVDGHSPLLVLALFSKLLADKQPDWPQQTVVTGFPFYDGHGESGLPPKLVDFLDDAPPPIVFTLGSVVSMTADSFYHDSVACARLLNRRAVLVMGNGNRSGVTSLPEDVIAVDYAPFAALFPRAAAVVHHGGIGTTGLAMWSGRPSLVVPIAWDQPDNAERAVRLGIARTVPRRRYNPQRAAAELRQLLNDPAYTNNAVEVSKQLRGEDGTGNACAALEELIGKTGSSGRQ